MKNLIIVLTTLFVLIFSTNCSGGNNPLEPAVPSDNNPVQTQSVSPSQTHLWGYYNLYIDIENQAIEVVLDREVMFAANVVSFLNNNPAELQFDVNSTLVTSEAVGVDIDVSITHPIPGQDAYNGYDVRGIFIGDGSSSLVYDTGLDFATFGTDQTCSNADGYTRWFNASEFGNPGILGFTDGVYASTGYTGSATLNPYKYFTNGLNETADLWTHLSDNAGDNGIFSSGTTNTRNYLLSFPIPSPGVAYDYAVVANWKSVDLLVDHPANCIEAPAINTTITDNVFYVGPGNNGGNLKLDVEVWGWNHQPAAIIIESSVLSSPSINVAPVGSGGGPNSSVYSFDIPADAVTKDTVGIEWGEEVWVICEYSGFNYDEGEFGMPAPDAELTAFFRYDLFVWDQAYNQAPLISSGVTGEAGPDENTEYTYVVEATDPDGDPVTYEWTLTNSDTDTVISGYNGINGNDGDNQLVIDFKTFPFMGAKALTLDCAVSDGINSPANATQLAITLDVNGDFYVSYHADFASSTQTGTQAQPFKTISYALNQPATRGNDIIVDYTTAPVNGDYIYMYNATWNNTYIRAFPWYTTNGSRTELAYTGGGSGYPVNLSSVTGGTIQGFKFTISTAQSTNYIMNFYYVFNFTLCDNILTGENNSTLFYGMYLYQCRDMKIKNNLITDLQPRTNVTGNAFNVAGINSVNMRLYGASGTIITGNEISNFIQDDIGSNYISLYGINMNISNDSNPYVISNNLVHHLTARATGSSYYVRALFGIAGYYYGSMHANYETTNNTVDSLDAQFGVNGNYGNPSYNNISRGYVGIHSCDPGWSPSSGNGMHVEENIVSNIVGQTNMYTRGYWHSWWGGDYFIYNWAYNYGDQNWFIMSGTAGTGCQSGNTDAFDPDYVNNTTSPYDYTLAAGSPCLTAGPGSTEIGCYGNLAAGEYVGLLTAE